MTLPHLHLPSEEAFQACFRLWQRLYLPAGHMTLPLTKSMVVFLRDADE